MAGKRIRDLPKSTTIENNDLFLIQSNAENNADTKSISYENLIKSIDEDVSPPHIDELPQTVTISDNDLLLINNEKGTCSISYKSLTKLINDKINDIQSMVDKPKTKIINITIAADNWIGESAPYTNTLEVEGVTDTNVIELTLPPDVTKEHVEAYIKAQIVNGSQAANSIIIKSWGEKPTINLPCTCIIFE